MNFIRIALASIANIANRREQEFCKVKFDRNNLIIIIVKTMRVFLLFILTFFAFERLAQKNISEVIREYRGIETIGADKKRTHKRCGLRLK